jgi:hypothetical protein
LVGDTDSRWSGVLNRLVDLPRHCMQDYSWLYSRQRYPSVSSLQVSR